MVSVLNYYLDDSGIRYPNRKRGTEAAHGCDWFALGGILVREEDEAKARDAHTAFCRAWGIEYPLHSSEIRSQNENFAWLRGLSDDARTRFYEELYCLMRDAPVVGLACVVDRPGYNGRYFNLYEQKPWLLCKTAFSVAVERAAKYARKNTLRLRIAPERCNPAEDRLLKEYYTSLTTEGMPFATGNSEKYAPLTASEFAETLYEFRPKFKSSPMSQLADLFLWPICMGGYHAGNRPYKRLLDDKKLIECHLDKDDWAMLATKYSCFDMVERRA